MYLNNTGRGKQYSQETFGSFTGHEPTRTFRAITRSFAKKWFRHNLVQEITFFTAILKQVTLHEIATLLRAFIRKTEIQRTRVRTRKLNNLSNAKMYDEIVEIVVVSKRCHMRNCFHLDVY